MSKVIDSPMEAVADVQDGSSILIGGFGVLHAWPSSCITAIRDKGVRELTIICNTGGLGPISPQMLAANKQVKKIVASVGGHPYRSSPIQEGIGQGEIELELVPQGTLVERVRAGGAGIPGFYTPTGVGTVVERGKEVREIDGRRYLFERAITADFALVRAAAADPMGNLTYRGTSRNFNPVFATAGRVTIAEVDEVVGLGDLDPETIVTPGIYVDRVVPATIRMNREETLKMMGIVGRAVPEGDGMPGIPPDLMAMRAAQFFEEGDFVNLGLGLPTLCSNFVKGRNVNLHAEDGVLGYGGFPEPGHEDLHLYNASGQLVTAQPGTSYFHSADAFAMARGGHVNKIVLGGFQVAANGDLANWKAPQTPGGTIGGAMDLASGGAELIVLMMHTTKDGTSKIVPKCTYPLTALGCVSKVVTNLAYLDVVPGSGFVLKEMAPGVTLEEVKMATAAPLRIAPGLREMQFV